MVNFLARFVLVGLDSVKDEPEAQLQQGYGMRVLMQALALWPQASPGAGEGGVCVFCFLFFFGGGACSAWVGEGRAAVAGSWLALWPQGKRHRG